MSGFHQDQNMTFGGDLCLKNQLENDYSVNQTITGMFQNWLYDGHDNPVGVMKNSDATNSRHWNGQVQYHERLTKITGKSMKSRSYENNVTISIYNPLGNKVHEASGLSFLWGYSTQWEYTPTSPGTYCLSIEIDTGDWNGVMTEDYTFEVSGATHPAPDFNSPHSGNYLLISMVNFNRNYLVEGQDPMVTWLDEGLAMAAERLIYGDSAVNSRIAYYNSSPGIRDGHSLLYWDRQGEILANYSLSYLFLQYFKIQIGQQDTLFREILTDSDNDYRAIQNALNQYAESISFGDFMSDWRIAMMMKETSGKYGFKGDSAFNDLQTPFYTGGNKNLRGGAAIVKTLALSFNDPGDAGTNIQYVGIT